MSDTYAIVGFSNEGANVLFESESCYQCEQWKDSYIRFGDWGGYDSIALYEIAPTQSADTIHKHDMPIISWEKESI